MRWISPFTRATGVAAASLLLAAMAGTEAGAQVPVSPAMAAAVVQAAEPLVESALQSAAASAKPAAAQPATPAVAQPGAELLPQATPGFIPANLPAGSLPAAVFPTGTFPYSTLPAAVFPGSTLMRSSLPAGSLPLRANTAALLPPAYNPTDKTAAALVVTPTTPEQKLLAKALLTEGEDEAVSPEVSGALGLTKGNAAVTLRELTNTDTRGLVHTYARLPDGGVMVGFVHDKASWNYRYDSNMSFVSGAVQKADGPAVVIPTAIAGATGETQLEYWAEYAGLL
jgi:hypothetical protein